MVTVKLDKERHLRLTLRGMLKFEELTGGNLFKGFDMAKMTFKERTTLLYVCLIHEDKELTFDNFIDIVDLDNIEMLADALVKCINESLPDIKGKTGPLIKKKS